MAFVFPYRWLDNNVGVGAIRREFDYLGYEPKFADDPDDQNFFEWHLRGVVRQFQKDQGLLTKWGRGVTVIKNGTPVKSKRGVVGRTELERLFTKRVYEWEKYYNINDGVLHGLLDHESWFDPAVTGYVDPNDRGMGQFNSAAHPEVTDEMAFDPAWAIPATAKRFRDARAYYRTKVEEENIVDGKDRIINASILQHNTPVGAIHYLRTGEYLSEKNSEYVRKIWVGAMVPNER